MVRRASKSLNASSSKFAFGVLDPLKSAVGHEITTVG